MKKNGFTLIELLAVIVILAIIALIATPIILNIINDAKEESNERSVELYASAVRNGIAAYQLRTGNEVATDIYKSSELDFVEYDGDVVCDTVEIYEDGGVYVTDCTVNGNFVKYAYGTKKIIKGNLDSICTPAEKQYFAAQPLEAGYKYNCKVDPNKEAYTFYVLTSVTDPNVKSVNLIMDSNINISGNAVKESETDLGEVAWYADAADNSFGPITALNHLQTATSGWTNTNEQIISAFTDNNENSHNMTKYVMNARMPYLSEISNYSASLNNAYLYDNFVLACYDGFQDPVSCDGSYEVVDGLDVEGIEHISGVSTYWILSSYTSNAPHGTSKYAYMVALISTTFSETNTLRGVRPVINLSI